MSHNLTATLADLNFPPTPRIVNSQAGQDNRTKISAGEPLEIIYTSKGKFLRVSRTGDLFAIKDNKDVKSTKPDATIFKETTPNDIEDLQLISNTHQVEEAPPPAPLPPVSIPIQAPTPISLPTQIPKPIMNLFDSRDPEPKPVEQAPVNHNNSNPPASFYKSPFLANNNSIEESPIASSNNCSTSNVVNYSVAYNEPTSSPLMPGMFSSTQPSFPGQICCNCKLTGGGGDNFIRGCACPCHHGVGGGGSVANNQQAGLVYSVQPVFVSQFPNSSPMFYSQQAPQQQQQVMQPQFVMNSLSNSYAAPRFCDERNFNMINMSGGAGGGQGHPDPSWFMGGDRFPVEYIDHGGQLAAADQLAKGGNNNNPIYSSYDFSDL